MFKNFKINLDISRDFYVAFNDPNRTTFATDNQITISNVDDENLPDTKDQHNEFILIDLQCRNSFEVLLNANEKLQNFFWILLNMNVTDVRKLSQ